MVGGISALADDSAGFLSTFQSVGDEYEEDQIFSCRFDAGIGRSRICGGRHSTNRIAAGVRYEQSHVLRAGRKLLHRRSVLRAAHQPAVSRIAVRTRGRGLKSSRPRFFAR